MQPLNNLQSDFLERISDINVADDPGFRVYQNNFLYGLIDVLKITYPNTCKVLGEECFNSAVYNFIKKDTPKNADLDLWGSDFPNFLNELPELANLSYLYDLAKFEWLQQLAYLGEETVFNNQDIQRFAEMDFAKLYFLFDEYVQFYKASCNVIDIYNAVKSGNECSYFNNEQYIIIFKHNNIIVHHKLNEDLYKFLYELSQNSSFESSVLEAMKINESFDIAFGLQFILQNNLLKEVSYD